MTECASCQKQYPTIFPRTNQGMKCAAYVSDRGITGAYGSTLIDMQHWSWIDKMPDNLHENDVVCDDCIKELIEQKKVYLKEEGVW